MKLPEIRWPLNDADENHNNYVFDGPGGYLILALIAGISLVDGIVFNIDFLIPIGSVLMGWFLRGAYVEKFGSFRDQ